MCCEGDEIAVNISSLIKDGCVLYEVHDDVKEFKDLKANDMWGSMLVSFLINWAKACIFWNTHIL